MIPVKKAVVQPPGAHNKPEECVSSDSISHLVKYPFPYLNPMQSLFAPYVDETDKNIVVTAPTCAGKCIGADSIVLTRNGMMEIGEIGKGLQAGEYRDNKETISTPLTDGRIDTATQIYRDGVSDSIQINTEIGFELCATPSHRIKVISTEGEIVWKYMKELVVGDVCVLTKGQQIFGNNQAFTVDDGYWCGMIAGDGGMTIKNTIRFTNQDKHLIHAFEEYSAKNGLKSNNNKHSTSSSCRELSVHDKNFKTKLNRLGFKNVKSTEKTIPLSIRTSPKEVVAAYIRGLFETDGWVQYSKKQSQHALCIALSNKKLVEQLQVMLLNFGIVTTRCVKKTTRLDSHILSIYPTSLPIFISEIGLDLNGYKFKKLKNCMEVFADKGNRWKYDLVFNSHKLLMRLRSLIKTHGSVRNILSSSPVHFKTFESWSIVKAWRVPTKPTLRRFVDWLSLQPCANDSEIANVLEKLQMLLREDLVFDRIDEISTVLSDNYDFVVPETHSFVGNGFVNHNTVVAELACAQAVFGTNRTRKAMYLAPMKALTDEKLRDWAHELHTFTNLKITALTSDYVMNAEKKKELEEADIILCTSEMLDSKSRNYNTHTWLHTIGVVVVDESHLIGAKGRGPALETAIMRFSSYNPEARFVLMSATCPNSADYAKWLNRLTGKKTLLIKSDYRPCKLNKHFVEVDDGMGRGKRKYADLELGRMQTILDMLKQFPADDQVLVFTGNKSWGKHFLPILKSHGYNAEFHNADLGQVRRQEIETNFNDGKIKVLIASSTLSWGVNVNARRVILAHTSYGLEEMEVADIEQACGRAGRIKYHNEGDAYILLPASKMQTEMNRILGGFTVNSKLNDVNVLIFHIVNEINSGNISDKEQLYGWYEKSLASVQNDILTEEKCQMVLDFLTKRQMIRINPETGKYETTKLGYISAMMYQHPLNVSDWFNNFSDIAKIDHDYNGKNKDQINRTELEVCMALADVYQFNNSNAFISAAERDSEAVKEFAARVGGKMSPQTKAAAVYYYMLKDKPIDDALRSLHLGILNDLPRVISTIKLVHTMYGAPSAKMSERVVGWQYPPTEWDSLFLRLKYGIPRHLTYLASLPEIGKTMATKLYDNGVRDKYGIETKPEVVKATIGPKRAEKMYAKLRELQEKKKATGV